MQFPDREVVVRFMKKAVPMGTSAALALTPMAVLAQEANPGPSLLDTRRLNFSAILSRAQSSTDSRVFGDQNILVGCPDKANGYTIMGDKDADHIGLYGKSGALDPLNKSVLFRTFIDLRNPDGTIRPNGVYTSSGTIHCNNFNPESLNELVAINAFTVSIVVTD